MSLISLIHPSRGRAQKSFNNSRKWMELTNVPIQLIVSVDKDDPQLKEYMRLYNNNCLVGANSSVVEATNRAAAISKGEILLYLSDDFDCFPEWGEALVKEFEKYTGPTLIKVDDCLQLFPIRVLTIPIMNRQCYDKLGYFFHPGYKSMFCDEHLYYRSEKIGALKMAPHIKFEHKHVSVGKADNDEIYDRSAMNWNQGKALMEVHRRSGFAV